jgi:[ribosomal protein S5]-alanine N-acetyltransferase
VFDQHARLPVLTCRRLTLRDLRPADAPALLRLLTTEEVTRFMSPPPTTVEGFERFVEWAIAEREAGRYMCFALVPHGRETAVGIIQVRPLTQGFATAEWGFSLGRAFWGTGLFVEAAELVLAFAFDSVGVRRLEARTAVANGRGNGVLRKLGARREAILRESFCRGGHRFDQILWSILDEDWRRDKASGARPANIGAPSMNLLPHDRPTRKGGMRTKRSADQID